MTGSSHPERIGPYDIIGVLGEGGMGVVYEALQTEPVRRKVALKLVRTGLVGARITELTRLSESGDPVAVGSWNYVCWWGSLAGAAEEAHSGRPASVPRLTHDGREDLHEEHGCR